MLIHLSFAFDVFVGFNRNANVGLCVPLSFVLKLPPPSYTFAPKLLGLRRLLVGAKHDVKSSFQGLGMLDIDTSVRKTSIT